MERRLPEKGRRCHWRREPKRHTCACWRLSLEPSAGAVRPSGPFGVPVAARKGELALVWPEPCSSLVGGRSSGTGQTGSQPHSTPSSPPPGEPLATEPVTGAGSGWKECCGAPTQRLRGGEQSCESQAFYLTLAEKQPAVKNLPSVAAQTPPTSTKRKGVRVQAASPLHGLDPGHTGLAVAMGPGMLPVLTPPLGGQLPGPKQKDSSLAFPSLQLV